MGGWSFGLGIGGRWDYTGDKGFQVSGSAAATGGYDGKNGGVGFDFSAGRGQGSMDFGICTNDASRSPPAVTTYGELLDQLGLGKAGGKAGAAGGTAGGVTTTYEEDDLGEDEDAISEYESGGGSTSGTTGTDDTDDTNGTDDTDDADDTDDDVDFEDDGVGGGGGDGIDGGGGEGSSGDGDGDDGCGGGGLSHLGGKHGSGGGGGSSGSSGSSGGVHGGGVHGGGDGEDDRCGTGGQLDVGALAHSHSSHGSGRSDGSGRPHVGPDDYFPDPEGNDPGNPITRGMLGLARSGLEALEVGSLRSLRVG